jgi:hypothetical protein
MVLTDTNELVRTVTLWEIPADVLKDGEKEAIKHGWTRALDPDDRPYWTHASGEKCWKMPKVFEQAGQEIVLEAVKKCVELGELDAQIDAASAAVRARFVK